MVRLKVFFIFITIVALYQTQVKKGISSMFQDNWRDFSRFSMIFEPEAANFLGTLLFKRFRKNYLWTREEDQILKRIVTSYKGGKHQRWKNIAGLFNKEEGICQARSSAQIKERWENNLKQSYKKGFWDPSEDVQILRFVRDFGCKWSRLAKTMKKRTEHAVKNRFFCLFSKKTSKPVTQIKREKRYLDSVLIEEMLSEALARVEERRREKRKQRERFDEMICGQMGNICNIFDVETFISLSAGMEAGFVFN